VIKNPRCREDRVGTWDFTSRIGKDRNSKYRQKQQEYEIVSKLAGCTMPTEYSQKTPYQSKTVLIDSGLVESKAETH
jgi:hypothetical protein